MSEANSQTPGRSAQRAPQVNRGRRGPVLKFLGTLRGDGALLWAGGETPVRYQLDVFQGAERTGSGSLDGDMPAALEDETGPARLRLADGRELGVELGGIDERGATFEARGAPPAPA